MISPFLDKLVNCIFSGFKMCKLRSHDLCTSLWNCWASFAELNPRCFHSFRSFFLFLPLNFLFANCAELLSTSVNTVLIKTYLNLLKKWFPRKPSIIKSHVFGSIILFSVLGKFSFLLICFCLSWSAVACPRVFTTPFRSTCNNKESGGDGSFLRLIRCLAWKIDPYFLASVYFSYSSKPGLLQVVRNFSWKSSPKMGISKI